jgi:hypothetical protein
MTLPAGQEQAALGLGECPWPSAVAGQTWDTRLAGLPPGRDTELLAEAGGLLQGRFLLTPAPGPGLRWSSGWSPSALPTRPGPHWQAPGWRLR